jgi:hypothetical protein
MRLRDGHYECTLCGAVLDITIDVQPITMVKVTGSAPAVRVILVEGVEVHCCPIKPDR